VAVATTLASTPAHAFVDRVINGTPNPPLAQAAMQMESDTSMCTGVLITPNLVATAAHCIVDEKGAVVAGPEAWTFYAPGADTSTTSPSSLRATQLFLAPGYVGDGSADGRDLAFLVLDGALGTPVVTRVASMTEVAAMAANRTVLDQVGYGQTVPRAVVDAPVAPIPHGLSAPADVWRADEGLLSITANGVTGTCAGDSGSPWLVRSGAEVLLVGVLSSGDAAPCDPEEGGSHDYVAVISAQPDLLNSALAAAGAQPLTAPRTCLRVPGEKKECSDGRAWTYSYCWEAPRYRVQRLVDGAWVTETSGKGRKTRDCYRDYPYLVEVSGTVTQGTTRYRLVVPRQPGTSRTQTVPFSVTST